MFREARLVGIVCFLLLLPLLQLLYSAAFLPFDGIDLFAIYDSVFLKRILNSVLIALWDVLLSSCFAFTVYWVFLHSNRFCKYVLLCLAIIPFTFPAFAVASSWMIFFAWLEQGGATRILWGARGFLTDWLYSTFGCGLILSLHDWPVMFFFLILTTGLTRHQIDAGKLYLSKWQSLYKLYIPAWKMPFLCGGSMIFVLALTHFETASLLQVDVYMLEVYTQFSSLLRMNRALILCLPVILLAGAFAFLLFALAKQISLQSEPIRLKGIPFVSFCLTLAVLLLSLIIPVCAFFFQTSFVEILSLLGMQTHRILNSLLYSIMGGVLIVLFGTILIKTITKYRTILILISAVLLIIPSIITAAGVLELRSWLPFLLPNWFSTATLLYAHVCRFALLGLLSGLLIWQHYGKNQMDYERLLDLTLWKKLRYLYLPTLWQPATKAVALIALLIWSDVAVTVLLHPPGGDTMTLYYFNQLHYGSESRTAATGFLLMTIPLVTILIAAALIAAGRKLMLKSSG